MDCPHNPASTASNTLKGRTAVSNKLTTEASVGMWKTVNRLLYTTTTTSATSSSIESAALNVAKQCVNETAVPTARFARLWTGVQTMMVGCAPAHALYFSSYELVKGFAGHSHLGNAAAGAAATTMHDCIMTPLDTMKQRLQLGHYKGSMTTAFVEIVRHEGFTGLYRSFGITLLTNIPYGMIMVTTNEHLKEYLTKDTNLPPSTSTYLLAGCGSGGVASAITTPLDRIKTRLQTQAMGTAMAAMESPAASAAAHCDLQAFTAKCHKAKAIHSAVKYHSLFEAGQSIVSQEGIQGLFRGLTPRVLTHMPAVAISWTTYETVKQWLVQ